MILSTQCILYRSFATFSAKALHSNFVKLFNRLKTFDVIATDGNALSECDV